MLSSLFAILIRWLLLCLLLIIGIGNFGPGRNRKLQRIGGLFLFSFRFIIFGRGSSAILVLLAFPLAKKDVCNCNLPEVGSGFDVLQIQSGSESEK